VLSSSGLCLVLPCLCLEDMRGLGEGWVKGCRGPALLGLLSEQILQALASAVGFQVQGIVC
jgi:hypothetical protein